MIGARCEWKKKLQLSLSSFSEGSMDKDASSPKTD
jgi:hypothetical protein